ncbi:hypothetical protein F5884DRAFT_759942 [Xylogone sp. PMI_703]|nr:hypothetical protein F5884DRAFT_759942 [Xylogone sp. PMI_703]
MTANVENPPRPAEPAKPPRKRKRVVISCTECHRRKQKCDRLSPCSNCVTRNKQSACHYENEPGRKQQLLDDGANNSDDSGAHGIETHIKIDADSAAQISALGYAKSNPTSTLGIFRKIDRAGQDPSSTMPNLPSYAGEYSGMREKYKSLIRQLPAKPYMEILIETYFREPNIQYDPLHEEVFREQLENWNDLPFSEINKGPQELSGDMRFFPALLFQMAALALHFQPVNYDPSLDSLKYAAGMSFDDLASDYSESGAAILNLLGKRNTTLVTVQAGFLRTAFLKNCGMVPESWHSLSSTIRDAQEIGLHKDRLDHRPRTQEDYNWYQWQIEDRRRLWLILSVWDVHMALVLGRPPTIDPRDGRPTFPIDSVPVKNRRAEPPAKRKDSDPPTPLSALLWNSELGAPLWDILNLEREGPRQSDGAKVEKMHKLINQVISHAPPYFRSKDPDRRWDNHPQCYWLARTRVVLENSAAFTVMALHRPYIFTNSNSRTAALNAGLDILRAQRCHFKLLEEKHYKMFSLVLNTFDAIVLVAAVYILYPQENSELLEDAMQHFAWGMERFHKISDRNNMAQSALNVLKAVYVRLKKAVGCPKMGCKILANLNLNLDPALCAPTAGNSVLPPTPAATITPATTTSPSTDPTPGSARPSEGSISSLNPLTSTTTNSTVASTTQSSASSNPLSISSLTSPTPEATLWNDASSNLNMTMPPNFDFSNIAPLQPMHDLLYNDLTGFADPQMPLEPMPSGVPQGPEGAWFNGESAEAAWQFDGDFGSDSFWGFMNTYNP